MVKNTAIGPGSPGINFRARRVVTDGSPPLRCFFGAVLLRCQAAEIDPAISYKLKRNTASVLKIFDCEKLHYGQLTELNLIEGEMRCGSTSRYTVNCKKIENCLKYGCMALCEIGIHTTTGNFFVSLEKTIKSYTKLHIFEVKKSTFRSTN